MRTLHTAVLRLSVLALLAGAIAWSIAQTTPAGTPATGSAAAGEVVLRGGVLMAPLAAPTLTLLLKQLRD